MLLALPDLWVSSSQSSTADSPSPNPLDVSRSTSYLLVPSLRVFEMLRKDAQMVDAVARRTFLFEVGWIQGGMTFSLKVAGRGYLVGGLSLSLWGYAGGLSLSSFYLAVELCLSLYYLDAKWIPLGRGWLD